MRKGFSRRDFLKTGALASAAVAGLGMTSAVHAADNNVIKVGLIGCGGRGTGAAANALNACPNAKLVAVGDAFAQRAKAAVAGLASQFNDREDEPDQVAVTPETTFVGLECYKDVIKACDVVLLCETPHFRPISLRYAIEHGKHVFCEKPVAVDAPGIRSVMKSAEMAKEKNLNIVSGLCWRYDLNVQDMMNRVTGGDIGEVMSVRETYLTGKLWTRARVEGDSEMAFQVRNWYNFAWLSGDFNVEQHVHSLDKGLWAFGNQAPIAAYGIGGRMARTEQPEYGDIYDAMSVVFEYPDGKTLYSLSRQQNNCWGEVDDHIQGTQGVAKVLSGTITGEKPYTQKRVSSDMYQLEHNALFNAIQTGETINNGDYMAKSTMLGILGRMVCYNGKRMTWEEALNSDDKTCTPDGYTFESNPPTLPDENGRYKVAVPGLGYQYHSVTR